MHPVIRVSLFLVFAVSVSRIELPQLIVAVFILFILSILWARLRWSLVFQTLKRLRWFFLTILVLYGWLTPGQALFETSLVNGPSQAGINAGVLQVVSLILMILALVSLISNLSKELLLGAIYWWSYPLKWLHISRERLVLRLILTMERVELLQQQLSRFEPPDTSANRWQRLASLTGYAFQEVNQQAEQESVTHVSIKRLQSPPAWQWTYPVLVVLLFQMSQHLPLLIEQLW